MQQILPRTRSGAIKPPTFGIPTPGGNPPYCKLAAAPLWQSHRSREGRFPFIPRTTESAVHITTRRTNDAELGCLASSTTSRATLLQFSLAQSRHRIKAMGIRSEEIDRFAKRLCLDSRIAFKFRNSRFQAVELIIQGLDLLTRTAER